MPYQELPLYAADRREVSPEQYAALKIVYAAHLGGIRLTKAHPDADLGEVVIPRPEPGVHAVDAAGKRTTEITVKPKPAAWPKIK